MKLVIMAKGESVPIGKDPHPEARITEPVVKLDDDHALKLSCERLLNPVEQRRFRFWYTEVRSLGYGVRPAVRMALRRQIVEATERLEAALKEAGR